MIKIDIESLADLKKYLSYAGQFSVDYFQEKIKITNENEENFIIINKNLETLEIVLEAMKNVDFNFDGKKINVNSIIELITETNIGLENFSNIEIANNIQLKNMAENLGITDLEGKSDVEIRKEMKEKLIAFADSTSSAKRVEKN